MPDGPRPYFPPDLLALLSRLTWSPVRGELGAFTDANGKSLALYLDKGERWGLYPSSAPGLGPFLVSKRTFDVIRSGKPDVLAALSPLFEGGALVVR
jgi:hypothetical protein